MSRRWLLFLLCLLSLLALVQFSRASSALRVDESATRVLLQDKQTIVSLVIDNPLGQRVHASVRLELVDPRDVMRASAERHAGARDERICETGARSRQGSVQVG